MQRTVLQRQLCPSVCPSIFKRVDCDKTKETYAHILTPRERTFIIVFWQEEWLVGDDPFYLKFWAKLTLLEQKCRSDFQSIFTHSASAVTPSEKRSIITNRKFTTRFPISLRWTVYVAPEPPKGAQKRKMAVVCQKVHLKKVCYKVSLCKYCQRRSCKAFSGLSIRAKKARRESPLQRKNLAETNPPTSKMPISYQYLLVAPQP